MAVKKKANKTAFELAVEQKVKEAEALSPKPTPG